MSSPPKPAPGREAGPHKRRSKPGEELPRPLVDAERDDVVWQELERNFHFYDRHASRNRIGYQTLKVLTLVMGAGVTVLAARGAPATLTALLGAGIVVAEGVQQVFQLHTNWITYRATAEALRHHAFQYVAGTDPYTDAGQRRDRLAQTLHAVTASENTSWASTMRSSATPGSGRPE